MFPRTAFTALLIGCVAASLRSQELPATAPEVVAIRAVSDLEVARAAYRAWGFQVEDRHPAGLRAVLGEQAIDLVIRRVRRPDSGERSGTRILLVKARPLVLHLDDLPRDLDGRAEELRVAPSGARSWRAVDPDGWVTILRTPGDAASAAVPVLGDLNPFVLEVLREYPTDGTHRYHWPRGGSWRGCTRNLDYGGELLCEGDSEGRAYCCGLTFEVFLEAWRRWCLHQGRPWRIGTLDLEGVRRLQGEWFGSSKDKTCLRTAFVQNGLGMRITKLSEARAGDFVQLWRHSGTGHSVIFIDWVRKGRRITGLRYWSTQKSTRGIGYREELFGTEGKALRRDMFYLCRAGVRVTGRRQR